MTNPTFIVADHGLFFHIAQRLARDANVLYYLMEEEPAPHRLSDEIGLGYENVKIIDNLWKHLDKKIPIVFTDVYNGGLPVYLKDEGFPVFGSLQSENIETDRGILKNILKKAKLPVVPFIPITGLTNAQKYLDGKEDKWLKGDCRGDFETYHYKNAFLSSSWFNRRRAEMGDGAESIKILIEDNVPSSCEFGIDVPMLNGEIGNLPMVGYERKDQAYWGKLVEKLPSIANKVHDRMKPIFKATGYQGWYSNEMRITDDKIPYYEDATCRFGRPPSPAYCESYKNFPQAVWELAHGRMPIMKPKAPCVAELILTSDDAQQDWLPVQFPKEIEQWVKLYSPKKTEKGYYCLPHVKDGFIGSVVGLGNTFKEATRNCLSYAEQVKGDGIEYHDNAFKHLAEQVMNGRKFGIDL